MKNKHKLLFSAACVLLLSGCGGGSSNSSTSDDNNSSNTESSFTISSQNDSWQIIANGTPLHDLDPDAYANTYQTQSYSLTLDATPNLATADTQISDEFPKAFGITLDGVKLDPLTAECYDASGNRQSNPTSSCTYRQDALQTISDLGFDDYFGHVQPNRGSYHYHAYSSNAAKLIYKKFTGEEPASDVDLVLIGLSRDGFPVYFSLKNTETSGYSVDTTISRTAFRGGDTANGLYVEDYKYVASDGTLDNCNGKTAAPPMDYSDFTTSGGFALDTSINYYYVVTTRFKSDDNTTPNFPAIPHCFKGHVSSSDGF